MASKINLQKNRYVCQSFGFMCFQPFVIFLFSFFKFKATMFPTSTHDMHHRTAALYKDQCTLFSCFELSVSVSICLLKSTSSEFFSCLIHSLFLVISYVIPLFDTKVSLLIAVTKHSFLSSHIDANCAFNPVPGRHGRRQVLFQTIHGFLSVPCYIICSHTKLSRRGFHAASYRLSSSTNPLQRSLYASYNLGTASVSFIYKSFICAPWHMCRLWAPRGMSLTVPSSSSEPVYYELKIFRRTR